MCGITGLELLQLKKGSQSCRGETGQAQCLPAANQSVVGGAFANLRKVSTATDNLAVGEEFTS